MSHGSNEEFVVLTSQSGEGHVMFGTGYSGSHAPGYLGVSGGHHRPTGHGHESLRYSEVAVSYTHLTLPTNREV